MNQQDSIEGLTDALAIRAGIKNNSILVHPAAEQFANGNVLLNLAEAFGELSPRKGSGPSALLVAGLNSNRFAAVLSDKVRIAFNSRLTTFGEHRLFCASRELHDFQNHDFPMIDTDPLLDEITENEEIPHEVFVTALAGLQARVRSFGKNVYCSRVLIRNDDIGLLFGFIGNIGAAAARLEAKLVFDLIESNPLLGDQMAMFHEDHGNLGAVAPLALAALSAGTEALRNMLLPSGEKANLEAKFMIVSPGYELYAKGILKDAGVESIRVIVAPWITSTNWYLVSDPQIAPTVSLLYLKGSSGGAVVGRARPKPGQEMRDGIALGIRFDVGAVPVGRVGIYKGRTA